VTGPVMAVLVQTVHQMVDPLTVNAGVHWWCCQVDLSQSIIAHGSTSVCLVRAGQQGTLSRSNANNRRHAYARPWQSNLATCTSNMSASMSQLPARHWATSLF